MQSIVNVATTKAIVAITDAFLNANAKVSQNGASFHYNVLRMYI